MKKVYVVVEVYSTRTGRLHDFNCVCETRDRAEHFINTMRGEYPESRFEIFEETLLSA